MAINNLKKVLFTYYECIASFYSHWSIRDGTSSISNISYTWYLVYQVEMCLSQCTGIGRFQLLRVLKTGVVYHLELEVRV